MNMPQVFAPNIDADQNVTITRMSEMIAKAKFVFLATAMGLAVFSSSQEVNANQKADACEVLAHFNASRTIKALYTFATPIFGKEPERWTVDDVENLLANAKACDNKPAKYDYTTRVYYNNWKYQLNGDPLSRFLAVANKSTQAADSVKRDWPQTMKLPVCGDLLQWKRDKDWLLNNSETIFGRAFLDLTETEKPIVKLYIDSCLPVMEGILKARRIEVRLADRIHEDIISSLDRDVSASLWKDIVLAPSLDVMHEGKKIPLAYVSDSTRDIVLKINTSEMNGVILDIDNLSLISGWVRDMERKKVTGPDALFVSAVKQVVSRQLFEQEKKFDR
jgi:hypothetical protein